MSQESAIHMTKYLNAHRHVKLIDYNKTFLLSYAAFHGVMRPDERQYPDGRPTGSIVPDYTRFAIARGKYLSTLFVIYSLLLYREIKII